MNDWSEVRRAVYARLDALGIPYRVARHAPAAAIEQCGAIGVRLGAVVCKNYFLTTRSRRVYVLCVARPEARLRTSDLSKQAGTPRLSFAGEAEMLEMLRARPGSVSPMGLLFDRENRVRLLVDEALRACGDLAFHPCDNTETLAMSAGDFFERFLPATGHAPQFVGFPAPAEENAAPFDIL